MTTKPRNGYGGWIALAMICAGGSTGGSYLRRPAPHNPDITTAAWNEMCLNVNNLERDTAALTLAVAKLTVDVGDIARRMPQQAPQTQP